MKVFNSLGSNYSLNFAVKSLFSLGSKADAKVIKQKLFEEFLGKVTLTYKGRHALELALKNSYLPAGSKVGISGFTCYAVYRAVEKADLEAVFIDVAKDDIQFGLHELKKADDIKAVIVQNTLGLPADMPVIKKYCQENNILIIEDLAHSYGAVYGDDTPAGMVGDLTMISFSADKQQDVVAGGALIDRRKNPVEIKPLKKAQLRSRAKNRIYPLLTFIIRASYEHGFGKFVHFPLKKLRLLATPMSDNNEVLADMSPLAAKLLVDRMESREQELEHRREIAEIYKNELPQRIQYKVQGQPTYLRFPLRVKNPVKLIELLGEQGIFIGDTWYDSPIAPKNYMDKTSYQPGDCPRAEELAQHLVNLPTHQNITPQIAHEICERIKKIGQES